MVSREAHEKILSLNNPPAIAFKNDEIYVNSDNLDFYWSIFLGKRMTERNPWHATTLEWTVPSPPGHGNFGDELPTVHRWPFDYSVPGEKEDFIPQTVPATVVAH